VYCGLNECERFVAPKRPVPVNEFRASVAVPLNVPDLDGTGKEEARVEPHADSTESHGTSVAALSPLLKVESNGATAPSTLESAVSGEATATSSGRGALITGCSPKLDPNCRLLVPVPFSPLEYAIDAPTVCGLFVNTYPFSLYGLAVA